jgi:hypothetical protein
MITEMPPGLYWRCGSGLPAGADVVSHSCVGDSVVLTVEHESFADVPDGAEVPDFGDIELNSVGVPYPIDEAMVTVLDGMTKFQIERQRSRWYATGSAAYPPNVRVSHNTLAEGDPQPDHVRE